MGKHSKPHDKNMHIANHWSLLPYVYQQYWQTQQEKCCYARPVPAAAPEELSPAPHLGGAPVATAATVLAPDAWDSLTEFIVFF